MATSTHIRGSEEAWETGALGEDEKFVGHLSESELASESRHISDSLGLQPISIRLEKSLIEDFKAIATINGLGYQTLMRQALKRFADCEKKRLLNDIAAEVRSRKQAEGAAHEKAPKVTKSKQAA